MKQTWQIAPRTETDLITQLLVNRGVNDQAAFLTPDYAALYDPLKLKNMKKLTARLERAVKEQETIGIFGDYDHDGTPAAALLHDGLEACGAKVGLVYIPTREEGYSLNNEVIDEFKKQGTRLLITVDCGITNKPEIDYAAEQGIESVVIDHHLVQDDKFPDQAIVVNPKQAGDNYPFKDLCACGLAFKVVQALGQATGKISVGQMKWYLDLVAISTIGDMVPLLDENRILVHFGLIVLQKTRRLGLQKLYEAAAIDPATISTYTVGFGIDPRLNAPGRMGKASIAYELLVSQDEVEATRLAKKLNELNASRQKELERVLAEAEAAVVKQKLHQKKLILIAGNGWSDGVVGLVAGRLMDKYHRPSIVLTHRKDGLAKGSARSLAGFNLVEALQLAETDLKKYGGHAKAAGLTLASADVQLLYDQLLVTADQQLTDEALQPVIKVDAVLRPDELTLSTVRQLAKLEPYGYNHPRPVFLVENATVVSGKKMGSRGDHLKLQLLVGDRTLEAVAFGLAERAAECQPGARLDLVGMLDLNEWQGRQTLQFKVTDWRQNKI